jgi:hypothetical protein
MLLNHVLVGVLLLPLGYLTLYAAPHFATGVAWAQVLVRTTAVTVAALPLTLLALMGVRYFQAPLFVLGFALVVAAAVTLLVWRSVHRVIAGQTSNQTMKPTAPDRKTTSMFAATPCRGLSLSR